MAKKLDKNELFEHVLSELKELAVTHKCDVEYFEKMMRHHKVSYDIFGGVPYWDIFKMIAPESRHTDEYHELVIYVDIILDLFYLALILVDDIMDAADYRLQKTCWYKIVGPGAAGNDSQIVVATMFLILDKHFSHLDCYINIVGLVAKTVFAVAMGQHFDVHLETTSFDNFTEENFATVVQNKASCTISLYIEAVLYLAGYTDPQIIAKAREYFYVVGYALQIQNDYWDCYAYMGSKEKSGTDIQERKCSWLAVRCLERATPEQKEIFYANYGKNNPDCVAKIKALYDEMRMPDVYTESMRDYCVKLSKMKIIDSNKLSENFYGKMIASMFGEEGGNFSNGMYCR